ncbi:hypothetical protein KP509_22G016100 [Ceratopteris richardii]|uniref:SMP-30/Gluconolactonase/LRE-like region domain-containing protein n=3 Tax=Ceratopteris richardii TaxID=49495 RepID=A0A8T2S505_CERRI|nr:hypothetical protein KP509_22G016100 [Ceratopteris richardii]
MTLSTTNFVFHDTLFRDMTCRTKICVKEVWWSMDHSQYLCLLLQIFVTGAATASIHEISVNGKQTLQRNTLPSGACIWHKNSGHHRAPCDFEVVDMEFLDVLGRVPKLEFIKKAPAHEGGVYFPDKGEYYFSSPWNSNELPGKPVNLMKMSLKTREVSFVSKTTMANGMTLDNIGNLVVCEQGFLEKRGSIQKINLHNMTSTIAADNWKGLPFNSPNDVVVKSDNSIWFTDPDYGQTQHFKGPSEIGKNQVYRVSINGDVRAVADGFTKPNGLAFSPDEKLLYVTDTGTTVGDGTFDPTKPHDINVFDVEGSILSNRRVFASVAVLEGSLPSIGVPDGIKVDTQGRVYTANQDGIQVFSPKGKLLGLIRVQGAVNMGFVGPHLDQMIITNSTAIHSVQLNVQAAGLLYAKAYHHHP